MTGKFVLVTIAAILGLVACGGDGSSTPPPAVGSPPAVPPVPPPPTPTGSSSMKGTPWSEYFAGASTSQMNIPAGVAVSLDVCDLSIGNLMVMGHLYIEDAGLVDCDIAEMSADSIRAMGGDAVIEIGTTDRPLIQPFELTLTGTLDPGAAVERRELMIMRGARLDIHGASAAKTSWVQLAQTATKGSNTLALSEAPSWEVGDQITLASSSLDPFESEALTITSVSADGLEIGISPAIAYDHFAGVFTYGGRRLDMRTEVGLLSHTVVIQGDEASDSTKIGGHIMIMNTSGSRPELTNELRDLYREQGRPLMLPRPQYMPEQHSKAYVEGVELRRMGQMGRPGRYSFHWHLVDDGSGQYIRNSSMHSGFQRAVNVHGTDGVTVERNVGFDIFNHMFVWAEEGDEVRNRFVGNLAVLNKQPPVDALAFDDNPDDDNFRDSIQEEDRPGLFWGANSYNTLHDNHAAGSWFGQGFFLDIKGQGHDFTRWAMDQDGIQTEDGVYGEAANADIDARELPEGCDFRGNVAHSIYGSQLQTQSNRGALYPSRSNGWGVFTEDTDRKDQNKAYRKHPFKCTLRDFTAYKTEEGGAWLENASVLDGAILADNNIGALVFDTTVANTVVVGQTENRTGGRREVNFIDVNGSPYDSVEIDFSQPLSFRGGVMTHPSEKDFHVRTEPAISTPRYGVTPDIDGLTCVGVPTCLYVRRNQKLTPRSLLVENLSCRETDHCLAMSPKNDARYGSVVDVDGSIQSPGAEILINDEDFQFDNELTTVRIIRKNVTGFEWPEEEAQPDR